MVRVHVGARHFSEHVWMQAASVPHPQPRMQKAAGRVPDICSDSHCAKSASPRFTATAIAAVSARGPVKDLSSVDKPPVISRLLVSKYVARQPRSGGLQPSLYQPVITELERLTGVETRRIHVDKGLSRPHAEHRMGRNYLRGRDGDRINAVLCRRRLQLRVSSCAGWPGFCAPSSGLCSCRRQAPNRPKNRRSTVLYRRLINRSARTRRLRGWGYNPERHHRSHAK
jgi:hypothetical protein